jgi:DNA-binding CsgD family transcriptional regulator
LLITWGNEGSNARVDSFRGRVLVLELSEQTEALEYCLKPLSVLPLTVLLGKPSSTPVLLPHACMWLAELPQSDEAWREFMAGVDALEAMREKQLRAVTDSFCAKHRLSEQERKLVALSIEGLTNDEASSALACSRATVSTYWNRVFKKVGLSGQREILAAFARYALG